jgi:hypothetical protein
MPSTCTYSAMRRSLWVPESEPRDARAEQCPLAEVVQEICCALPIFFG